MLGKSQKWVETQRDTIINVDKKCFGELHDPLEFILELNIARVTPDFKGGDRSKLGYCRSLPVLPYFSKIYQHIMYNRFQKYVLQKILYPNSLVFKLAIQLAMQLINLTTKYFKF